MPSLADGALVQYAKLKNGVGTGKVGKDGIFDGTIVIAEGLVVVFVSQAWWHRNFMDESNDKSDKYDRGAPDWQSGKKKDSKHRTICAGVERLIAEQGLDAEKVVLWIDWQSVSQEDKAEKQKAMATTVQPNGLRDTP